MTTVWTICCRILSNIVWYDLQNKTVLQLKGLVSANLNTPTILWQKLYLQDNHAFPPA